MFPWLLVSFIYLSFQNYELIWRHEVLVTQMEYFKVLWLVGSILFPRASQHSPQKQRWSIHIRMCVAPFIMYKRLKNGAAIKFKGQKREQLKGLFVRFFKAQWQTHASRKRGVYSPVFIWWLMWSIHWGVQLGWYPFALPMMTESTSLDKGKNSHYQAKTYFPGEQEERPLVT